MGGAVFRQREICVWGPPVGLGRTLGRVARPAEHGAVADVKWRAATPPTPWRNRIVGSGVALGSAGAVYPGGWVKSLERRLA